MKNSEFENKIALVTGGASGIGQALARDLASRGAVVIIADLEYEIAKEVASEIVTLGQKASAVKLDVKLIDEWRDLLSIIVERYGRIDFLFNNAGISNQECMTEDYPIEKWTELNEVNYGGVVNGVATIYKQMCVQGFGHIINTASILGLLPLHGISYSASKYAVVGLSLVLGKEARKKRVKVSVLCPGLIRTPLFLEKPMKDCPGRLDGAFEKNNPISAEILAEKSLDDVARNKMLIIHPRRDRWRYRFYQVFGELGLKLSHRIFRYI